MTSVLLDQMSYRSSLRISHLPSDRGSPPSQYYWDYYHLEKREIKKKDK